MRVDCGHCVRFSACRLSNWNAGVELSRLRAKSERPREPSEYEKIQSWSWMSKPLLAPVINGVAHLWVQGDAADNCFLPNLIESAS